MQKKFLHCLSCESKKWFEFISGHNYKCSSCDTIFSYIKLKIEEKKFKDKLKHDKGKKIETTKKNKREVDLAYLKYVRSNPCLVSNDKCSNAIHAHHSVTKGAGGSDYTAIPLCHICHHEIHSIGRFSFQEKYNINIETEIKRLVGNYSI